MNESNEIYKKDLNPFILLKEKFDVIEQELSILKNEIKEMRKYYKK